MGRRLLLLAALALLPLLTYAQQRKIKVACVGNSITYGSGIPNRDSLSYPAQLQFWLGKDYDVQNFGVSGATMLKTGDRPYWNEPTFQQAKEFQPDIVLIKLGTNDSKPQNWENAEQFRPDYQEMIDAFNQLPSRPRILLLTPAPVFTPEKWGISQSVVRDEVAPIIRELAAKNRLDLVDLHEELKDAAPYFPDQVHPDPLACEMMVHAIYVKLFHRNAANRGKAFNTATFAVPSPEYRGAAAGWGSGKDWFSQFNDINRIIENKEIKLVFLGNSITQGWGDEDRQTGAIAREIWDSLYAPRHAANFGISGDRTQHILWRIRNGNCQGISPKAIVLTIGVNNFRGNTAQEIQQGIELIVRELRRRCPESNILLLGPLPAGLTSEDPFRTKYEAVHQLIKPLGNLNQVDYVKIAAPFILADGSLNPELMSGDGIHLKKPGYAEWAALIEPFIQSYLHENE